MMAELGSGAARQRRERQLRSFLKHERKTVCMTLAEALHGVGPDGTNNALWGPKTARECEWPGVLKEPEPQLVDTTACAKLVFLILVLLAHVFLVTMLLAPLLSDTTAERAKLVFLVLVSLAHDARPVAVRHDSGMYKAGVPGSVIARACPAAAEDPLRTFNALTTSSPLAVARAQLVFLAVARALLCCRRCWSSRRPIICWRWHAHNRFITTTGIGPTMFPLSQLLSIHHARWVWHLAISGELASLLLQSWWGGG